MKILILDKDGTLTTTVSGHTFVQHPEDQKLLPGVLETINRFKKDGWRIAIASNQGGVKAGFKTLDEAIKEMRFCLSLLPQIELALFCPDDGYQCYLIEGEKGDLFECPHMGNFRKPEPGMINYAVYRLGGSEEAEVLFVGDRPEDHKAALNAGVSFMDAEEWRTIDE